MYFDTHAHYCDDTFDPDRDELLRSMPGRGVSGILDAGWDVESSRGAAARAGSYDFIWASAGVHPGNSDKAAPRYLAEIEDICRAPRVCAVGEIGLDYHYSDGPPRETQLRVFREQMELARSLSLPVLIHDREAHEDTLSVIREFPGVRGVLHCYSGSIEQARVFMEYGYMFSFTGIVTFKNARAVREVAAALPAESIMIETDCPYTAPVPHRAKRCDSSMVAFISAALAELRGVGCEEFAASTAQNAKNFFDI